MKKKNVGMIAYTTYPSDARVRREAESLYQHGYRVVFLAPKEARRPRTYYMDGVYVHEINKGKYRGKSQSRYLLSYFAFLFYATLSCCSLFLKYRFDIIHVHNMPNFLVFAAIIPRLFGKRVILDVHDTMLEMYEAKYEKIPALLYRFICLEEKISCRFAQKIICVNHVQRDALTGRGVPLDKISISMNVPDPRRFYFGGRAIDRMIRPDSFKLVYHGTLVRRLGIDYVIRAVAILRNKIPGLEFHIIGGGDDTGEFKDLSKSLGVEEQVHFIRFVPVESLEKILREMDVGVVSNRKNTATELMLPVKMLEYIALDIPVIAPRLKTIQHYFSDDMVSYYEPDNIDSLVDRIVEMHSDRSLGSEKAKKARSFLEQYGWETHEKDFIDIYQSLDGGLDSC